MSSGATSIVLLLDSRGAS